MSNSNISEAFSEAQINIIKDMFSQQLKDFAAIIASVHKNSAPPGSIMRTPDSPPSPSKLDFETFCMQLAKVLDETFFSQILKKYKDEEINLYR